MKLKPQLAHQESRDHIGNKRCEQTFSGSEPATACAVISNPNAQIVIVAKLNKPANTNTLTTTQSATT